MKLSALVGAAGGVLGKRFLLVSYLPTMGCALFLLVLLWAGVPGAALDFDRTWQTAATLGVGEILGLWLVVTLVAVVTHPLQLRLVRLLEGEWPTLLSPLRRLAVHHQESLRRRLGDRMVAIGDPPSPAEVNRVGAAYARWSTLYPPAELTASPTALGNSLAAMEYYAGFSHGLDVVVTWPRLYPLIEGASKEAVDTHRDALDAACRFSVTAAVTAMTAVGLLWQSGWWLLLPLIPAALSRLSYRGAVQAAMAYGASIDAAIDTYRFALYDKLCLPRPKTPHEERALNDTLCTHWRQRVPLPDALAYSHPQPESRPETATGSV
ncbi:hypothetical protein [Streptomyces sp. NBC_00154]|uniref:hypothetical protein n=1 Tax=Streptomyces sp. NBC_00154 TaxID=2975670 RepID=UPI00224CCD65|nr:hypothetical protein [Streptomyces sp. NBC_00154]MCX5317978.1 hypothetical protein [Streptomyces sp. NBC_00154]